MADAQDLARLQHELSNPFKPVLLALADWYEEDGQTDMADAYRRIVDEGKIPDIRADGWSWYRSHTDASDAGVSRYHLEHDVVDYLLRVNGGQLIPNYRGPFSLDGAYDFLARSYAAMAAEARQKEKKKEKPTWRTNVTT